MKMPRDIFNELETNIQRVLHAHPGAESKYKDAGLPHERFRWDTFWASKPGDKHFRACQTHSLNDNHVDTALRRILGKDYLCAALT